MSERTTTVNRVILSWPTLLSTPAKDAGGKTPCSWIQIARTGLFTSSRYGEFSITEDDLAQMLHNFNNVTPKAPTELPIDYDHLSMDPKKPGDGIAAGWMKRLELRGDGEELWAEVEWTEPGADRIEKGEYRFISPSFVKDHTHKDGRKIGTTLLAAAVTNHPFLEGMKALTLYSFSAMGDLALATGPTAMTAFNLAEVGQRLTFIENEEATPELSPQERTQVYVVTAVGGGSGDNAFVKLETADSGKPYGWYPLRVLSPAPPSAPEGTNEENMSTKTTETDLERQAVQFSARVEQHHKNTRDWTKAFDLAQREDNTGAEAYRVTHGGGQRVEAAPVPTPINLSAHEGETFDSMCMRVAHERGIPLRQAVREVSVARPDLAAARV